MLLTGSGAHAACSPDSLDLRQDGVSLRFSVEVANDNASRGRGLMYRESLPMFTGMLFVFEKPGTVGFWMKNTLISLDMLFIDEAGTVQRIAERTTPHSTEVVEGGDDVLLVLEVNGGLSAQLGIEIGAEIRHPSLDQTRAAWSCDNN